MSIFTKAAIVAVGLFLAVSSMPELALGAKADSKMVTRIETAKAAMKGTKLVLKVDGMATTSLGLLPKGGQLVRRGQNFQPNKDGLLEYELHFTPPRAPGDKLRPIKAQLTERSVPAGVKGVRVFAEYNQVDALFPLPKEQKKKK